MKFPDLAGILDTQKYQQFMRAHVADDDSVYYDESDNSCEKPSSLSSFQIVYHQYTLTIPEYRHHNFDTFMQA